jgi:hypothetical protein
VAVEICRLWGERVARGVVFGGRVECALGIAGVRCAVARVGRWVCAAALVLMIMVVLPGSARAALSWSTPLSLHVDKEGWSGGRVPVDVSVHVCWWASQVRGAGCRLERGGDV